MLSSFLDFSFLLDFQENFRFLLDLGSSVFDFGSSTSIEPPVTEVPVVEAPIEEAPIIDPALELDITV